jgi:hypothetical protein
LKLSKKRAILNQISWVFLAASVLLFGIQIIRYSRMWNYLQPGTVIAGVPVGGLSRQAAAERLTQIFASPVELHYQKAVIQIYPSQMGFKINETTMLDAAEAQHTNQPSLSSFWAYLWGTLPRPKEVPLIAVVSEDRIRQFLQNEIVTRYDQPPLPMMPFIGSTWFLPGKPGAVLNIENSIAAIEKAMRSASGRVVTLNFDSSLLQRPSLSILATMLKQIIYVDGFDGMAEVYFKDLKSGEEFDFAVKNNEDVPPDIAFTAASTMKIPIMVTIFQRVMEPTPQTIADKLDLVFRYSENPPADSLLQTVDIFTLARHC